MNVTKEEMTNARFFVGSAGGQITCIDKNGEEVWRLGFMPGVHYADLFKADLKIGESIEMSGEIALMRRNGRVRSQKYGETAFETGANPDYRPTTASTQELRLRKMMAELDAKQKGLTRRIEGLKKVREIAPEPETVLEEIEPKTEPATKEPEAVKDAAE